MLSWLPVSHNVGERSQGASVKAGRGEREACLSSCVEHAEDGKSKLDYTLRKKATIHRVTTMLATFKNVQFPGHNHLQTTGADDPTLLIIARAPAKVIIKVRGHQHWWLAGGYDLEMERLKRWLAWWLPGG